MNNTEQNHGENTSQNNELSQRTKIDGTPFYMIKQTTNNDKDRYFLVMGDYRITEPTETENETLDKLKTEQWLIITNVIAIATEKMIKENLTESLNLIENLTTKDKQTILTYL